VHHFPNRNDADVRLAQALLAFLARLQPSIIEDGRKTLKRQMQGTARSPFT
jgi:hypothetical protein